MTFVYVLIGAVVLAYLYFRFAAKGGSGADIKQVQVNEAKEMLKDKSVIPLDVRTPGEVAQGKIKGAKTINVTSPGFVKGIKQLDRSKTYLVYCRSGRRSLAACNIMKKNGFENVVNLQGGFNAWG